MMAFSVDIPKDKHAVSIPSFLFYHKFKKLYLNKSIPTLDIDLIEFNTEVHLRETLAIIHSI